MPNIVKASLYIAITFMINLMPLTRLSSCMAAEDQNAWELISNDDGIAVYKRTIAHSNFLEFRGVGVIDISVPKMIALMADVKNLPNWIYGCIQGELIEKNFQDDDTSKQPTEYYQILYGVNELPWPLNNRDYVLKAQVSFKAATDKDPFRVTISSRNTVHPNKPPIPGLVRMPNMAATFIFSPVEQSKKTLVDFSVTADPGGVVPAWITNIAARSIPRNTFLQMRKFPARTDYSKKLEQMVLYHYNKNVSVQNRIIH